MQRDEIDVMWQQALRDSVKDGEMFTRYHFAKMVAAKEREEIAEFIDSTEMKNLPEPLKQHYARMLSFYSSQIRARGEA